MNTHSKRIAKGFNRAATTYKDAAYLQHHVCRTLTHFCKNELAITPHILDLGCGPGILHNKLQSLGINTSITGLDIAESSCKENQQQHHQPLIVADAHTLPIQNNSFPCIFSSLMMQWSPNFTTLCEEIYRTLKPLGVLAGAITVQGTLQELTNSYQHLSKQPTVLDFNPSDVIIQTLKQTGFKHIEYYTSELVLIDPTVKSLLKSIQSIGANTSTQPYEFKGKAFFNKLETHYASAYPTSNGIYSTWNILYVKGIK